jgi:hypothetical protein
VLIEDGLFAYLTAYPGVNDLAGTRMYPAGLIEQDTVFPCITYQQISGREEASHQGRSGVEYARFQIEAVGLKHCDARNLAIQINVALSEFRGTWGAPDGVRVGRCSRNNRVDYGRDAAQKVFRVAQDYLIVYQSVDS